MIPGDIADVLRATPYIKALRKRYPRSQVTALVSERGVLALKDCPYLDRTVSRGVSNAGVSRWRRYVDKAFSLARDWSRLWRRFDLVISLAGPHGSGPLWNLLALGTGAPDRIGYDIHGSGRFLSHNLGQTDVRITFEERFDALFAAAGVSQPADDPYIEMWSTKSDWLSATHLLREHGVSDHELVIAICPGSDWSCQEWSLENWAIVADSLARQYGARIIVLGVARESHLADDLARRMEYPLVNLTGKTTLSELGPVLARCQLALTLESAPCAIAMAVGTPTVALFGSIPVWIRGQHRAPAVGIRECDGFPPTVFTICKNAKMRRAVHRCESHACIGGDGLTPIGPSAVLRQARAMLDDVARRRDARMDPPGYFVPEVVQ